MKFDEILQKVKHVATDLQKKAIEFQKSDTYNNGVSMIKENWEKLKNKRVRIEDKTENKTQTETDSK